MAGNPDRFLQTFLEHLELEKLRFVVPELKTEGRPRFEAKQFLNLSLNRVVVKNFKLLILEYGQIKQIDLFMYFKILALSKFSQIN